MYNILYYRFYNIIIGWVWDFLSDFRFYYNYIINKVNLF